MITLADAAALFGTIETDFSETFDREVRRLERCIGRHEVKPMLSVYVVHKGSNESKPDRLSIWVGNRYATSQRRSEETAHYGSLYAESKSLVPFITLLCEAWIVQTTPERLKEIDSHNLLPSQCHDRVEIVLLAGATVLQHFRLVYRAIKRDKQGRVRALGDVSIIDKRDAWEIDHFGPLEAFLRAYRLGMRNALKTP